MKLYEKLSFDEERALYGERDITVKNCRFDGPADGESAFKEAGEIVSEGCYFNLRYPFWHCDGVKISNSEMTELCRAALWYSTDIEVHSSKLHGIKAVRECRRVRLENCDIVSPEFGWFSSDISARDCSFVSEYFMLHAKNLDFKNIGFKGKYSFQYIKDSVFEDCVFDTKDAFWHAENVIVRNSLVRGEYLAWYSKNLTLESCKIIGTQPFCYCENLRLINCETASCDLSFEKSSVSADIRGHIDSIKNPESGCITVDSVGEIIYDTDSRLCEIKINNQSGEKNYAKC